MNAFRQRGGVLLTVLIVLVVMTIGALGMIRASDTSVLIAGNMAFRQTGVTSAELAVESALSWLAAQADGDLWVDQASAGYYASFDPLKPDSKKNESWEQYWAGPVTKCWVDWVGKVTAAQCMAADDDADLSRRDEAGNRSAYVIHRMCLQSGDSTLAASGCQVASTTIASPSSSRGSGLVGVNSARQIYYRITVQTSGLRNTRSFVQVMVAL